MTDEMDKILMTITAPNGKLVIYNPNFVIRKWVSPTTEELCEIVKAFMEEHKDD